MRRASSFRTRCPAPFACASSRGFRAKRCRA
jgi:hypothetical protein